MLSRQCFELGYSLCVKQKIALPLICVFRSPNLLLKMSLSFYIDQLQLCRIYLGNI